MQTKRNNQHKHAVKYALYVRRITKLSELETCCLSRQQRHPAVYGIRRPARYFESYTQNNTNYILDVFFYFFFFYSVFNIQSKYSYIHSLSRMPCPSSNFKHMHFRNILQHALINVSIFRLLLLNKCSQLWFIQFRYCCYMSLQTISNFNSTTHG